MGSAEIWALPCLPLAGPGMGAYLIPEVGAGVWVEFEAGDASYPIWSGGYWGDGQAPVDNEGTSASATLKVIRSKEGLMVTLNDKEQVITVSDKEGKNVVTIDVTAGKITVKGATKAIVEAPQIELVENATHPVVFGDQLMTYLNSVVQAYQSHVHPGQLAGGFMPVTPAPPVAATAAANACATFAEGEGGLNQTGSDDAYGRFAATGNKFRDYQHNG